GHINVLHWWKCSGLELKFTVHPLIQATRRGELDRLQWWKESRLLHAIEDGPIG
ncbi:hypothetical protein BJ742DRAFT_679739, partial [Cladochytrium replicatum]